MSTRNLWHHRVIDFKITRAGGELVTLYIELGALVYLAAGWAAWQARKRLLSTHNERKPR